MDVQLKELIEKIKAEGVENAEIQSQAIIQEAEKKAHTIIEKAEKEASSIKKNAKMEADRFRDSGKEAVKHAARDLILALQKQIEKVFDQLIKLKTSEVMQSDYLESAIVTVLKNWKADASDLTVLVPEKELDTLEKGLKKDLAKEIEKGLEIKPHPDLEAGFRVSQKDGSAYYNFTAEGIAEVLAEYLNPKIAELVRASAKESSS